MLLGTARKRLRTKTPVQASVAEVAPVVPSAAPGVPGLLFLAVVGDALGEESRDAKRLVYLITFSHPRREHDEEGRKLVPPGNFTRPTSSYSL